MIGGPYVLYSEITGITPTEADIASMLQPLDVRNVLFLLCWMNMHLRLVRPSDGISFERAVGSAQEFLFRNFTDESLFEQIKTALKCAKTHERVLFHPLQLLRMMRCAITYCQGTDKLENVSDEQRFTVGRCCLMVNNLLTSDEDNRKLFRGSDNIRRAELMTQLLPGFEVQNPSDVNHLLNRSIGMFKLLLSDSATKSEILNRTGNYDFPQRFRDLTRVELERWIAILFCFIAYFNQYGGADGTGQDHRFLWIDPRTWVGTSNICEDDLTSILGFTSRSIVELDAAFEKLSALESNVNIAPFKFYPLIKIGSQYICGDYAFLVEKMFSGAYWTIHDREDDKGRKRLSSAWGILFERYCNWWAQNRSYQNTMTYYPFPAWDNIRSSKGKSRGNKREAFDAAIVQGRRFMALEYKGGFLSLEAKYCTNIRLLLRDLNKKIAKGCRQLARNIGELFGIVPGPDLQNISTKAITRVIPVIVVQDQALRSVGVDWWMKRQFQREMRRMVLRPEVTVEPVTLIHVNEFETMIDSAEGPSFGLLEAIQLRNFRDQEGMGDLCDHLQKSEGYGTQHSSRRGELESEVERCVLKYASPSEYRNH